MNIYKNTQFRGKDECSFTEQRLCYIEVPDLSGAAEQADNRVREDHEEIDQAALEQHEPNQIPI